MIFKFRPTIHILWVWMVGFLLSCGSATHTEPENNPAIEAIEITPANVVLRVGEISQYSATGTSEYGDSVYITRKSVWTSDDPSVAEVFNEPFSERGKIKALKAGTTTIRAKFGKVTGQTQIKIKN